MSLRAFMTEPAHVGNRVVTPRHIHHGQLEHRDDPSEGTLTSSKSAIRDASEYQLGPCSTPQGEQDWEHPPERQQYDSASRGMPSEAPGPQPAMASRHWRPNGSEGPDFTRV
jgi:hypothetical protein